MQARPGGGFGYLPQHSYLTSDYLAAALPLGPRVLRCEEPPFRYPVIDPDQAPSDGAGLASYPADQWARQPWFPAATNAAYRDTRPRSSGTSSSAADSRRTGSVR